MPFKEILRIALLDMIARRSAAATLAIVVTIVVLTGVTIAGYGLVLGQKQVSYYRISNDPLLGCLWVGDPELTKRAINWERVDSLNQMVLDQTNHQDGFTGCFPFRLLQIEIYSQQDSSKLIRCSGRTYVDASTRDVDPILASLEIQVDSKKQIGIVLTPSLLKKLGWSESDIGNQISVRAGGMIVSIPVAGVAKKDLPYGLDFIIPETLENSQVRTRRAQHATEIISGSSPEEWAKSIPEILEAVDERQSGWSTIQAEGVSALYDPVTRQLILSVDDNLGRDGEYWGNALALIVKALPVSSEQAKVNFLKFDMTRTVPTPQEENSSDLYDMAGFYFSNLTLMPVAEQVVQRDEVLKGFVDTGVIKQLSAADSRTKTALQIVSTFEFLIAMMAITNLLVVQWFRAAWQRREAGMLRACGMRSDQLILIAISQGTIVWLLGNTIGLLIGLLFGNWMASVQYLDLKEIELGFCSPVWLGALATLIAWLLCCGTNLVCSLRSCIIEPAELVDDV